MQQVFKIFFTLIVIFYWHIGPVLAQGSGIGVSIAVPIQGEGVEEGHLISLEKGLYQLSSEPNDPYLFGVVNEESSITLWLNNDVSAFPVISQGQVKVKVNGEGGSIQIGDWVTSSSKPGIGMKSKEDSGMVLGQALEVFDGREIQNTGTILVALYIHNPNPNKDPRTAEDGEPLEDDEQLSTKIKESIADIFTVTADVAYEKPSLFFRYLMAGIVIVVSILFGYFGFMRISQRGVEAIGRNPLARSTIMVGIVLNIIVASLIIFAGIIGAYYIIRL